MPKLIITTFIQYMKHIKNIHHTKVHYLNLENIFLHKEYTNLENIYLNFFCMMLLWPSMKKTFSILVQFKPICTSYNFLFHVDLTNSVSSNKTLLRNIYILFTIDWFVQKMITKFIKGLSMPHNTRHEKTRDIKSILEKILSKRIKVTDCRIKRNM